MFRVLHILTVSLLITVHAQNSKWYEKVCQVEEGCSCLLRQKTTKCCCVGLSVTEVPSNFTSKLKILLLYGVGIERIKEDTFAHYQQLEEIFIEESPLLKSVDANAFAKLDRLAKVKISRCIKFVEVTGTLLFNNTKLLTLSMDNNALTDLPQLKMFNEHQAVEEINFSNNAIQRIERKKFLMVDAVYVDLSNNRIRTVESGAFATCKFIKLDISDNPELEDLSKDAFAGIAMIRKLDLSRTGISSLPTHGLRELETLIVEGTPELKKLPPILAFTALKHVKFTYAHHCCLFKHAQKEVVTTGDGYTRNIEAIQNRICREYQPYRIKKRRKRHANGAATSENFFKDWDPFFSYFKDSHPVDKDEEIEIDDDDQLDIVAPFENQEIGSISYVNCTKNAVHAFYNSIVCSPMPNALNPCENVVGYEALRYAIWFIWIAAILGNIGVWFVLLSLKQTRMRVHYFFMANLSTADLLTGVYLGMLAIEDVRTSDEYYNYAVEWQTGSGCQIAGFISVFASELSILSMFLIAFEMWYNVRYAFYGRRFKERIAYICIAFVYVFSLTVAILPIFGVSSYTGTSVCLPLTINNWFDKVFLMSGLLFNLFAFLGMVFCYASIVKMLLNPEQPSRPEDNAVIAKMALLIFTDMVCWFPTLFFGITASLNIPLISISVAKIFLVFFYPINAFANPFLYVFFTKIVQNRIKPCLTSCLRRLSQPGIRSERTYSTLLNFYHNHPPNSSRKLEEMQKLMQEAVRTPELGTPRGSSASTSQKTVTSILSGLFPRNSLSPRLSVPDEPTKVDTPSSYVVTKHGKTFAISNPRISTAPDMSDISENSMSEDQSITKNTPSVKIPALPGKKFEEASINLALAEVHRPRQESSASNVLLMNIPEPYD